jgi:hypothetical protein
MDRDTWCDQFVDEPKKRRPHVTDRLALTLALRHHDAKAHPRGAARQYDMGQRGESVPAAKRHSDGAPLAAIPHARSVAGVGQLSTQSGRSCTVEAVVRQRYLTNGRDFPVPRCPR